MAKNLSLNQSQFLNTDIKIKESRLSGRNEIQMKTEVVDLF